MKRRSFIKQSLLTGAALGSSTQLLGVFSVAHAEGAGAHIKSVDLPREFDEIDHFSNTHKIRDGKKFSIPDPSRHHSVVIVGGGISGLTAMSRLEETDCLIIEKEAQFGGNSRRRKVNGIHVPLGAIVSQGAEAPFTDFFEDLNVPFEKIKEPESAYFINNQLVVDPLGEGANELPLPSTINAEFAQLKEHFSQYLDSENGIFFPIEDNVDTIRELDSISIHDYFKRENFSAEAVAFLDLIVSSRLGRSGDRVSAWMACYILSRFVGDNYTLPGGHGVISELLVDKIKQQRSGHENLSAELTVVKVAQQDDDTVWVTGVESNGDMVTVSADAVIMATPKLISKYVVQDLPQDKLAAMSEYQYSAYLVAQVELTRAISPVYEVVSNDLFSRFIVSADWQQQSGGDDAQRSHLTVYVPYPGVAGRVSLFHAEPHKIAQQIYQDLETVFPNDIDAVEKITLHRWGHPMVMPEPNMSKRLEIAVEPMDNIFFAHSDNMGICGLYSAVWSGMDAYTSALIYLEDKFS